VQACARV
jgi:hypothetical protein